MVAPVPTRFESRAFGVLFASSAFFFLWTVWPIWVPIFLGVLMAVVASPLARRLEGRLGRYPKLLAAAITAATLMLGLTLVGFVGFVVIRELIHFLTTSGQEYFNSGLGWLRSYSGTRLLARLHISAEEVTTEARGYVTHAASHLSAILSGVLGAASTGILTLIFTALTSYYLLLDGQALIRLLLRLLPLPQQEIRGLMREFQQVCIGILFGTILTGLFQGIAGGLVYWACGAPQPLVWGALTAAVSLVPTAGTALVAIPLGIAMILAHHVWQGVAIIVAWATIIVGVADYVVRPRLLKGRLRLHSLLVFIAIFGGLEAFGLMGLVLGPLFVALFIALIRIYDRDYRPAISASRPLAGGPPSG